jgi:hypothetical protein
MDVLQQAVRNQLDNKSYTAEQAILDFGAGLFSHLGGDALGDLVAKHGTEVVARGLKKAGLRDEAIAKLIRSVDPQQGTNKAELVPIETKKSYRPPGIKDVPVNPNDPFTGLDVGNGEKLYGPFYRTGTNEELQEMATSKQLWGRGQNQVGAGGNMSSSPVVSANAYTMERLAPGKEALEFYTTAKPGDKSSQVAWALKRGPDYELIPEPGISAEKRSFNNIESDVAVIDLIFPRVKAVK